jgi:hypothetical protein
MTWFIENWYIVIGVLAVLVAGGFAIYKFAGLPTKEQIKKIKELLLYWVTEAETQLGSGTGVLKLRYVYDLFTTKFPVVAKIISFETFSIWVNEALDQMEKLLEENEKVKEIVIGDKTNITFSSENSASVTWVEDNFKK